jgi:hypothetical protein
MCEKDGLNSTDQAKNSEKTRRLKLINNMFDMLTRKSHV